MIWTIAWMDLEGLKLSEINERQKDMCYYLYVKLKNKTNEQNNKTKQTQRYKEKTSGCQKRVG